MKVVFKVADNTNKIPPRGPALNSILGFPPTVPTTLQVWTAAAERRKHVNYTSYYVNTQAEVLNDKPGDHESLVKKVRDKIKQEASTKIAGGAAGARGRGLVVLLGLYTLLGLHTLLFTS